MKKILLFLCLLTAVPFSSCDSALAVMQGLSNGLDATSSSYYGAHQGYDGNCTQSSSPEWHNCSSCGGSGNCKYCGGTGIDNYTRNKRCGVCHGTGKCAGCNGRGGYKV